MCTSSESDIGSSQTSTVGSVSESGGRRKILSGPSGQQQMYVGRDLAHVVRLIRASEEAVEKCQRGAMNTFINFEPHSYIGFALDSYYAKECVESILDKCDVTMEQLEAIEKDPDAANDLQIPEEALSFQQLMDLYDHRDKLLDNLLIMQMPQPESTRLKCEVFPDETPKRILLKQKARELLLAQGSISESLENENLSKARKAQREKDIAQRKEDYQKGQLSENLFKGFSTVLLESKVTAKVTKGGTIYRSRVIVVVGNGRGVAGIGMGKGPEPRNAMDLAARHAMKNLLRIPLYQDRTIFHTSQAKYVSSIVKIWPLQEGRGIRACRQFVSALEVMGIRDLGAKLHGPKSMMNGIKALFKALALTRSAEQIASARGKLFVDINSAYRKANEARVKQ